MLNGREHGLGKMVDATGVSHGEPETAALTRAERGTFVDSGETVVFKLIKWAKSGAPEE